MNEDHRVVCASDEWRAVVEHEILPWAVGRVDLGDDLIEVGPGPGLTTDVLRTRVARLTAVELDPDLAGQLAARLAGTNVEVVEGDATALSFEADRFSAGVSFTMLHHVPTAELQDKLFAEMGRVVAPGGMVVFSDSVGSDDLRAFHENDVYNPVDPATVGDRLERAGLVDVEVQANEYGWLAHAHAAPG
jgi:SAM-dependent methyltransferase